MAEEFSLNYRHVKLSGRPICDTAHHRRLSRPSAKQPTHRQHSLVAHRRLRDGSALVRSYRLASRAISDLDI